LLEIGTKKRKELDKAIHGMKMRHEARPVCEKRAKVDVGGAMMARPVSDNRGRMGRTTKGETIYMPKGTIGTGSGLGRTSRSSKG
jgi:hypothetical protein